MSTNEGRWFTADTGQELDLDAFTTLAQLKAALGVPADADLWLTDAAGRDYEAGCLFAREPGR